MFALFVFSSNSGRLLSKYFKYTLEPVQTALSYKSCYILEMENGPAKHMALLAEIMQKEERTKATKYYLVVLSLYFLIKSKEIYEDYFVG